MSASTSGRGKGESDIQSKQALLECKGQLIEVRVCMFVLQNALTGMRNCLVQSNIDTSLNTARMPRLLLPLV